MDIKVYIPSLSINKLIEIVKKPNRTSHLIYYSLTSRNNTDAEITMSLLEYEAFQADQNRIRDAQFKSKGETQFL